MFNTAYRLIQIPLKSSINYSIVNSLFVRKVHFKFSSSNYEHLNQSQFSKQLGLQSEYKKVIKIQKSNESSSFRVSATGFIIVLILVCGYVFIRVIDNNQRKLLQYKISRWTNIFYLNKQQQSNKEKQLNSNHQRNLKQIFDKKYKNRSVIDAQFLKYLDDYVQNGISLNKIKKQVNPISSQILKVIDEVREKFQSAQQQKISRAKEQLIIILEKIISYERKIKNQDAQFISKEHQYVIDDFAKFLLKKGNLNNQLLGFKYLHETHPFQNLQKIISKQQIRQIEQNLQVNNKFLLTSMKNSVKTSYQKPSLQENETAKKIYSIKEQIFYSIPELKKANEIRINKIIFIKNIMQQIRAQNKKK